MSIEDDLKGHLEYLIRREVSNRVDVGISVFSIEDGSLNWNSSALSYEDCVAVAALMLHGFGEIEAARLVVHDIIYAFPHFPGREIEAPEDTDPVGARVVGIYRLPDGSLWSVLADNDIGCSKPAALPGDYAVVATRGMSIVDEAPADRVKHLLTRCDEFGRYLVAA